MQKEYFREIWLRIKAVHIISRNNVLWMISVLGFGLTIFGAVTASGVWHVLSIIILAVISVLYAWHFLIEIPAKILSDKNDLIQNLTPLQKERENQTNNPTKFISVKIDHLMVEQQKTWIGCRLVIYSRLPYKIGVQKVECILWMLTRKGNERIDLATRPGESIGSLSGEVDYGELTVVVHKDNSPLSENIKSYIGTHPCQWIPGVYGQIIMTTLDSKQLILDIKENSVIAVVLNDPDQL